jgi:uncharacterized protein YcaQ
MNHLSNQEARWLAIAAQGLGTPRRTDGTRRPGATQLGRLLDRVGTIQLDAVNVLERTQFLVPFSRIGDYDRAAMRALTGPGGRWFEYWGHAASVLPLELYPLFRWRMDRWRHDLVDSPVVQQRRRDWRKEHARYLNDVLRDVTERGPMTASQLADPRRRPGEWWERRSDGRRALELLFGGGQLAAWRSPTFERVYDLTERVIAPAVLARPEPPAEEAQRELLVIAARCMGVATAGDLADYFWIRPGPAKLRVAELVEEGRLLPVSVEGWNRPAYASAEARPREPRRHHGTLLSPFDSLIWTRDRTQRLFDFHYRIEIYVPEPQRRHGYYVMPLLLDDALVARVDLKADRQASTLRVSGSYLEPGAPRGPVAEAGATELDSLRRWLGLDHLAVSARGNLAPALRRALAVGS